jgi:uncharacterized protein YecT (DUF1311 family)
MKVILLAAVFFLSISIPAAGHSASFDCKKAKSNVEKIICADAQLTKLDEQLANGYSDLLRIYPVPVALKVRQKQWLHRRNACGQNSCGEGNVCKDPEDNPSIALCLKGSYEQRLREVRGLIHADLPCPELPIIKSESEKARCLQRWLARHPLEDREEEYRTQQDRKFCADFYHALATASAEVRYIDPVLRTEDPQHPGLAKYRQCRDFEPTGLGYDYFGLDRDAHGFRIYRLDLDGNPKNGLEQYLYEEESQGSVKDGATQYVRVEFLSESCQTTDYLSVVEQEPRFGLPVDSGEWGLNALISFRARHYIFDLRGHGSLSTTGYEPDSQKFSTYQCNWRIPDHLLTK